MVARIVVLVLPSQFPDQGIVRSQDSTERSWFKVSRFCYMLMKYSCDRRHGYTEKSACWARKPMHGTVMMMVRVLLSSWLVYICHPDLCIYNEAVICIYNEAVICTLVRASARLHKPM